MTRRKQPVAVRKDWKQSAKRCWSLALGERGCRVLVFQRQPSGEFYRRTWSGGRNHETSLRTRTRSEARQRAEEFYRALRDGAAPRPRAPLTLGELWTRYEEGCARFLTNTTHTQTDQRGRAQVLLSILGAQKARESLTVNDVDRYVLARRRGGIDCGNGRVTEPCGLRTVEADLQLLRAMLMWACKERGPDGEWLREEYPLRGLKLPKEENPKRPIADYGDFVQLVETCRGRAAGAKRRERRAKWVRLEIALILAEATGRRIGSIRGLRWSDVRFDEHNGFADAAIRWDAEFDKKGRESVVPIGAETAQAVFAARASLGAAADTGWIFPKASGTGPITSAQLGQWLREAKQATQPGAQKAAARDLRGGWHGYRRKWATERKGLPTTDVMEAGGWRDEKTFRVYQQHDAATIRNVMTFGAKLRDGKLVATAG